MKKRILQLFILISLFSVQAYCQNYSQLIENEQTSNSVMENEILVLDGATIIDGTGSPLQSSMSITIKNGKISTINKQGETNYPSNAKILQLENKYVIPGFIEMHAHLWNHNAA